MMAWNDFEGGKVANLVWINLLMHKEHCHNNLVRHAILSVTRNFGTRFVSELDNDSKNASKFSLNYLEMKQK